MSKRNIILLLIILLVLIRVGLFLSEKLAEEEIKDPLLRKIKAQGEIVIGTDATYPPMESIDEEGNFFGMDIDIAKEIATDLKVQLRLQNIIWEELFDAVREGQVDMIISSITITPERAETMSFSDPYFNAGQVIIIRTNKQEIIRGVEDLWGYSLGVQIETTSEKEAQKYTAPTLVKSYENYNLAKEELLIGEIDAIIIDYPAAVGMVAGDEDLQIVGGPFTQEFYGIATQKNQTVLISYINNIIRRLKREGDLKSLEEKWLSQ